MSEITTSIISKVKAELNITKEIDVFELHKQLYSARKNSHPDLFEDGLKEKATEKFKTLNVLYSELKTHMNGLRLEQSPNELAIYEKSYETVIDKSRIIELEGENKRLESTIKSKEHQIDTLKKEVQKLNEAKNEELNKELINVYQPKTKNFLVLGISALLILVVNILAQITSLKTSVSEIFPFGIQYLNYILFGLLIFLIFRLLTRNWKFKRIQKITEELKSSSVIKSFYQENRKEKEHYYSKTEYFLESDIEEFIKWRFLRSKYRVNLVYYIEKLYRINDLKSLNYLKDIFIYNLITKGYIRIGSSKKLDREFMIE
ncbi:hypothetical protein [Tenacibaculum singaporense]|uniref:J domain-containing protein n=1 Tax=Tenacibaculum singaporense TaxID=2358479 RepID=A0A3Q8RLX9_9FLAO|nr:hypothetical protein [Tenacibaculum singaporense]AZJ34798.1 hypothetical protein D6T69_04375 [Tenacibaculum singaporense]